MSYSAAPNTVGNVLHICKCLPFTISLTGGSGYFKTPGLSIPRKGYQIVTYKTGRKKVVFLVRWYTKAGLDGWIQSDLHRRLEIFQNSINFYGNLGYGEGELSKWIEIYTQIRLTMTMFGIGDNKMYNFRTDKHSEIPAVRLIEISDSHGGHPQQAVSPWLSIDVSSRTWPMPPTSDRQIAGVKAA